MDPVRTPAAPDPDATAKRLLGVAQANGQVLAVGPGGRVIQFKPGDQSWEQATVPASSDLVAVRFASAGNAWAVGHDGILLRSRDAGRSWTKQLDGADAARLMLLHAQQRAVAGDPASDARLAEAERFVEEGPDKPFFDVLFVNETDGFLVGAFNIAFRTKDGGATWQPIADRTANPQGLHLYSLAVSAGAVYLLGEQGLIRRWNPEHEKFDIVESPYKGSFFGALGNPSMLIAFGMRGNAFRSRDGGKSWSKLPTGTVSGITAGTFLPDGRIALVTQGRNILVSSDGGESFREVVAQRPMSYYGVAPAGNGQLALVGSGGLRLQAIN